MTITISVEKTSRATGSNNTVSFDASNNKAEEAYNSILFTLYALAACPNGQYQYLNNVADHVKKTARSSDLPAEHSLDRFYLNDKEAIYAVTVAVD